MTVNSFGFLVCFAISVVIYYLIGKKYRWMVLLGTSLLFYHLMGVDNFAYVLITCATLFIVTGKMHKIEEEGNAWLKEHKAELNREEKKAYKAKVKDHKRHWLVWGVLVTNLGILLVLKYGNFFIDNVNQIMGRFGVESINHLGIMAPLGISFYTLQSIGYALEVYKGKVEPERNPLKVLLFVTYYPQMTQGPIGRYPDLAPQLFEGHDFSYHNLSYGCQRILWGLFKKAVIADNLKLLTATIFGAIDTSSGFTLLVGCAFYVIHAYADFSGYTDIVLGVSQIYGIDMMENFERPLFADSLADYWRRWHLSLSSWFRDYVFYPASISKPATKFGKMGKKMVSARIRKLFPVVFALSIVWFCTGFWHDASWRYILWGVSNGVVLISAIILEPQFKWMKDKLHINDKAWWYKAFCILRTFAIVALLKVFPAAANTGESLLIVKRIFTEFNMQLTRSAIFPGMKTYKLVYIAFGLMLFLIVSVIQEWKMPMRDYLAAKPFVVRWFVYFMLIAGILAMGAFGSSVVGGFEYAQF